MALLVSGGHTQLIRVGGLGRYTLLGETLDDAAGEAFDKTAKLLGLGYPGGAALSRLAEKGDPARFHLPRPMLKSPDLDFSFSGLKTAALTLVRKQDDDGQTKADIARAFQDAIVEVLVVKSLKAVRKCGLKRLVVAGGVSANSELRRRLTASGIDVYYPDLQYCTDNGAMIALAGAMRFMAGAVPEKGFDVRARWDLEFSSS
ncbi:MAG: hypothetical protein B7X10_06145 [Burkholderiales bacterium 21-58-4]|nr:MAG: hypothetical protein B7X10_06145 [Burkholderiales bacterium 21-58-4]